MFSNPQKNVENFNLDPGMRVADFGSGSGHYAIALARKVSKSGRVYAVDVQKDLLQKLKNEAQKLGLSNIEAVWGDIEHVGGTKIIENSLDAIVVSNVLFQVQDKDSLCKEAKRILKPRGRVFIIDWTDSFGGLGPQLKDVFPEFKARELFEKNGFVFDRDVSVGDHHYGIIFKKQ
ncbi:methyltransferase domain-containing protein [Candidatus Nomurabacteria bacterium]|nr:methyltransferase domain-containing protein [Candidatus Nomurabacteria bacterium]